MKKELPEAIQSKEPVYSVLLTGHFKRHRGYRAWRLHGTGDWLMILTVEGVGRFGHAGGGETVAGVDDLVLIRPHTLHDYGVAPAAEMWELVWTHFHPRPHWLPWLNWPEEGPGVMRLSLLGHEARDRVVSRFREMHELATGPLPGRDNFAMNALEEVLLWCDAAQPQTSNGQVEPRIQAVLEYIQSHLEDKISLDRLAEQSGLSPSRLSQLFRQQIGQTPIRYLEDQRLSRARQMLVRTTQPIGTIAQAVGFDNPFYFTLRFKRATGLAPTDFRKQLERMAQPDARAMADSE